MLTDEDDLVSRGKREMGMLTKRKMREGEKDGGLVKRSVRP